jgi:hypothetical protein
VAGTNVNRKETQIQLRPPEKPVAATLRFDTSESLDESRCKAIHKFKLRGGFGGREGARTPDLLVANEALSQLSYTPIVE